MVRKENVQAGGNSLLRTAADKRAGPGRFASLIARGTAKPPVKKVKFSSSDASRVSDMTATVVEDRPAVVKEVRNDDIDVESSVFGMSVNSVDSYSFAKAFGNPKTTTPQPLAYRLPPKRDAKNMVKKSMEIQPGLSIKAPSPMSLDRIHVQMGQERTAPESAEYKKEQEERRKIEEKERLNKEYKQAKKAAAEQLKEVVNEEVGEGFEAQLEDDDAVEEAPAKKKSLVKKMWGKLRPKKPMTTDRAHAMAREAMEKFKGKSNSGKPPLVPGPLPVQEIAVDRDESISDLDNSQRKGFPVHEILMKDEDDSRDDTSVSTLGTAHILERMAPGPLNKARYGKDVRDPTPTEEMDEMREEMFLPPGVTVKKSAVAGLEALIDQIDSGTGTEDAGAEANVLAACAPKKKSSMDHVNPGNCGLSLALCMNPLGGSQQSSTKNGSRHSTKNGDSEKDSLKDYNVNESRQPSPPDQEDDLFTSAVDAAISHIKKGMTEYQATDKKDGSTHDDSSFTGIDLKKTLSPIEEDEYYSPRNRATQKTNDKDYDDVIDLTNLASPMSPTTQDGIKGEKGARQEPFSFDNFMDIAASKLTWKKDSDRYAVEDESSRNVIHGHDVEADSIDDDNIPVVKGYKIRKSENQTTPKASGSQFSSKNSANNFSSRDRRSTQEVASPLSPQSSFEVYEHPEGDIVMWSENPIQSNKSPAGKNTTEKGFPGHFSDGLFDLLSMDESVSRGRKKVPFLSEQPTDNPSTDEGEEEEEAMDDIPCMFDFMCENDGLGGQKSKGNKEFKKISAKAAGRHGVRLDENELSDDEDIGYETMDPNLGVMCGAVPLYFMYTTQNKKQEISKGKKKNKLNKNDSEDSEDGEKKGKIDKEGIVEIRGNLARKAMTESTPKQKTDEGYSQNVEIPLVTRYHESDAGRDKVLLDGDDAYWDTLSTIASTKDRSSDSAKITNLVTGAEPGPIPVEITMKNKTQEGDNAGENSTTAEMKKAIGTLTNLIEEENSTDSLNERMAAFGSGQKSEASSVGEHLNGSGTPAVGPGQKSEASSEVDHLNGSRSHNTQGQSDYTPPTRGVKNRNDEESDDNSGLLLTITRSEGDEDAGSPRNEPYSSLWSKSNQRWRGAEAEEVKDIEKVKFHGQGARNVKRPTPESDRRGKVHSKPEPEGVFPGRQMPFYGILSGNAFANPWKSSNRSVSWGVEEIYEPEETPVSPSSTVYEDTRANKAIMSAAAEAAATKAAIEQEIVNQPHSPTSHSSQSGSGDTRLSDEEEQELISRTLELSKQLLASMTSQDLEGADNDIVRSLLSFGTNETSARSSLPEARIARSATDSQTSAGSSLPEPSETDSKGEESQTPKERPPTPSSVRPLGPVPETEIFNEALFHVLDDAKKTSGDISESQSAGSPRSQQQSSELLSGEEESSPSDFPRDDPPSIRPIHSGRSEDSPIDVEAMFNKYDNLANHLIEENAELKTIAQTGLRDADPVDENNGVATTASPKAGTRLEQLRAHRAEAMAKLQSSRRPASGERQFGNRVQVGNNSKDHLSRYMRPQSSTGRSVVGVEDYKNMDLSSIVERRPQSGERPAQSDASCSGDSNMTTPSMKARELRKQLDQALQASRSIKQSQEELGSELENFKNRFYRKHEELEDQAVRAIGGL